MVSSCAQQRLWSDWADPQADLSLRWVDRPCPEVTKLEFFLKLKIKHNDWLLVDTCPQAANHCAYFEFETGHTLAYFSILCMA